FLVALPAGYFMDRKGYKAGILVGLCLYALGALAVACYLFIGIAMHRKPDGATRFLDYSVLVPRAVPGLLAAVIPQMGERGYGTGRRLELHGDHHQPGDDQPDDG
ncbi:hypothetical protein ISX56_34540, partial [Serratia ureilytica]|nr:hypothetical protein [Serratia ureilytica]